MKITNLLALILLAFGIYNCSNNNNPVNTNQTLDSTKWDFYDLPAGDTVRGVFLRITGCLANPVGIDSLLGEEIYLKNFGKTSIDVTNFYCADRQNNKWQLVDYGFSTIAPNESIMIKSKIGAQLSNTSDDLKLVDNDGYVYQMYSYTAKQDPEGDTIKVENVKIKVWKK